MTTFTIDLPDTFTIESKAANRAYTIETAKIADLAALVPYALGVILQRAPAGKADDKAESHKAITTRIESLYNGTQTRTRSTKSMFDVVAAEMLAAIAKTKGKKLPKRDSDEYKVILVKFAEASKAVIEAEVARRAESTDADLIDFDNLF